MKVYDTDITMSWDEYDNYDVYVFWEALKSYIPKISKLTYEEQYLIIMEWFRLFKYEHVVTPLGLLCLIKIYIVDNLKDFQLHPLLIT